MKEHDRYAIYEVLDKKVIAKIPKKLGGYSVRGKVKDIVRDPLKGHIRLFISNKTYQFQEPNYIYKSENNVFFVYGEVGKDINDEELFELIDEISMKGGNINDVLSYEQIDNQRVISFQIINE